jgi:hypothetical protein
MELADFDGVKKISVKNFNKNTKNKKGFFFEVFEGFF